MVAARGAKGASSASSARGAGGLLLLWRASGRETLRRPGQLLLAVAGVALGVAVVIAVALATGSAERAFQLATAAATGRATHQIVGSPEGLPESLLPRLVLATGVTAAPVVEDWVAMPARAGQPPRLFHLLGIDPFSEGQLRPYLAAAGGAGSAPAAAPGTGLARGRAAAGAAGTSGAASAPPADLSTLLLRPGTCLLAATTAAEVGLHAGDRFTVRAGGAPRQLELAGVIGTAGKGASAPEDGDSAAGAIADLLVMDIAAAQELLGRQGRLDHIDLRLPPDSDPAVSSPPAGERAGTAASTRPTGAIPAGPEGRGELARISALLPPGAVILPASAASRDALAMTRAFRINLAALSLLAMVCGAFLIYNTMTFAVVQRRPLLGTLRALGVTRGQVLALVMGEAAAVAVAGTAAGLVAGVVLARGLLHLVTQTINDLYFAVSVRGLDLAPGSFFAAAAIGVGATLAAALAPALEAALTPPRAALSRSVLEARLRRALPRATALGGALLLAGALALAVPPPAGGGLVLGFAGLGAVIVGCALLAPAATVGLMRLLRVPLGALLGVRGRMAAGGVVASLSRTAVAIAALMIAVAVTVGIGVMIDSFRRTVAVWLERSLPSDLYVSAPAGFGGFGGTPIAPEAAARAAAVPGVAAVHGVRRVELRSATGPIWLLAVDPDRRRFRGYELREGDAVGIWRRVAAGGEAMVSEPFSRRWSVHAGDTIGLPTADGERRFRVAGVFADYTSDLGLVLISRPTYLRFWHDPLLSGFSVDLERTDGGRADPAAARTIRLLRQALGPGRPVTIRSNRALRRLSLEIFDRTFLITGVLRLLAGLVAAIGVLSALTALQLERTREIGVLRATGLTPGQVWQLITAQTGLMGLAAGLLALPVGLVLSAIMVYVINRRSFGWTIHLEVSPTVLVEALLLALGTALAAGLYPAWRMARIPPALALREE